MLRGDSRWNWPDGYFMAQYRFEWVGIVLFSAGCGTEMVRGGPKRSFDVLAFIASNGPDMGFGVCDDEIFSPACHVRC